MRALLKTDVYGSDAERHCGKPEGLLGEGQHLGLKGMAKMLDNLAKTGNFDQSNCSFSDGRRDVWVDGIDRQRQAKGQRARHFLNMTESSFTGKARE